MDILIPWSGGYDSTAALICALETDRPVHIVQFGLECNNLQMKYEMEATDNIWGLLHQSYPNIESFQKTTLNLAWDHENDGDGMLVQPMLWATGLAASIPKDEDREIWMGYIKSDVFWHVRTPFEQAVQTNLQLMTKYSSKVNFHYPNEWLNKIQILEYLEEMRPGLYRYCHTCENPVQREDLEDQPIKKCGNCEKCKEEQTLWKEWIAND